MLPILALVTATARPASAGLSARLVYLRSGTAEACPDQLTLKKAVARRLGYDPFLLTAGHTIVAELSGTGADLRARARLLDETGIELGNRELVGTGTDCAELLASLALAISLTLDPMAAAMDPETELPSEPEPTAPTGDAPSVATAPKRPLVEPSRRPAPVVAPIENKTSTSLSLQAGALASAGWVPAWSPAASFGLVARRGNLSLGAYGVAVASQTKTDLDGSGANVSVTYAAISPCYWVVMFGGCALGTLGRYSGRGTGVDTSRAGSHLHAAAGARAWLMLPLSERWSIGMHVDGVALFTRPQFLVAGREVFRPGPWAADLGVSAIFQVY